MSSPETGLIRYLLPTQHIDLLRQLVVREVQLRYKKSFLGAAWLLITPLLMLGVYTLVFRVIFQLRWGGAADESNIGFALRLYAGLAVFSYFAECVNKAPRLILEHPNFVKQVVFPLELLAWVNVLGAVVHLCIAAAILIVGVAWEQTAIPSSVLALPFIWLPLLLLALGLSWFLGSLGTYVRDVGQAIGMLTSLLMFLSPIFFPVEAIPPTFRDWIFLNPLALTITQTRQALFEAQWPDPGALFQHTLVCLGAAIAGSAFFRFSRKGFADVV